ncbi:hypothetical protein [Pseudovibrio sp. Tun.PSC04-5.I4]|uniref:hypothetical protein n=1 Tax=Pseudovibrio sp. Tun.PSC04-5.I4 TaxID=1798213 RepID=UPI001FCB8817|nr:hypothetical protein [Pseudovibrio sp. Tun.PSC04-5.I4]
MRTSSSQKSAPSSCAFSKAATVFSGAYALAPRWAMGDGRWAMGDGRWAMGDGRWAMGDGIGLLGLKPAPLHAILHNILGKLIYSKIAFSMEI